MHVFFVYIFINSPVLLYKRGKSFPIDLVEAEPTYYAAVRWHYRGITLNILRREKNLRKTEKLLKVLPKI